MDITRLEEFITLSDCLNYTKAANLMFVTQPVLSRHIHDLEEELGDSLFIRDTHNVYLTPFGEMVKKEVSHILEAYHGAMRNIKLAKECISGNITIGFLDQAVKPFITQFVDYIISKPQYQLDYTSVSELDDLIKLIDGKKLDLGFVTHMDLDRIKGIEVLEIMHDRLLAAVSPEHPLAVREEISVNELSGLPHIGYDRNSNPHAATTHEKLFKNHKAKLTPVRTVNNIQSCLFYTQLGIGYSIIPDHLSQMARDLKLIPITDDDAWVPLRLIWKKDNLKPRINDLVKEFSLFYHNFSLKK